MTSILNRITERKLEEVSLAKKRHPLNQLSPIPPMAQRDFIKALEAQEQPAIIAEIKKASPSKGLIRQDFDVAHIASIYNDNGARCLSVLTDTPFFQGHPNDLALAKKHCNLPVLRKDFIIDAYQIHESLALGADCILLIVALLDETQLLDFCQIAQALGLAVLVESHTPEELEKALKLPTPLIGINNRSLHTFKTDLQLSIQLKPLIPDEKIIITESGIHTPQDIQYMRAHGIHAFLIGESLMRAENTGEALRHLIQAGE